MADTGAESIRQTAFSEPGGTVQPRGNQSPMKVFVHLAHGFGRTAWKSRFDQGEIIGINHDDPYGYQQANAMGCVLQQSEDMPEWRLGRLIRLGGRAFFVFDLVHAWRNRRGILHADVVWTHTESQSLAILLLLKRQKGTKPKLIAQTVWLMDAWDTYAGLRRQFYLSLLRGADLLTFLSPPAMRKAQHLLPAKRTAFLLYGIRTDQALEVLDRPVHTPARLLMLGNDRHRDWPTFITAVKNDARYTAKAITRAPLTEHLQGVGNVVQEVPTSNEELFALFRWADIVVICLTENLHASGITVVEEAVLCGLPVICTHVGGIESYFTEDEITYVPVGDPEAVRQAVQQLAADAALREGKVRRALSRMKTGNINSRSYVAQHVALSQELLNR